MHHHLLLLCIAAAGTAQVRCLLGPSLERQAKVSADTADKVLGEGEDAGGKTVHLVFSNHLVSSYACIAPSMFNKDTTWILAVGQ